MEIKTLYSFEKEKNIWKENKTKCKEQKLFKLLTHAKLSGKSWMNGDKKWTPVKKKKT